MGRGLCCPFSVDVKLVDKGFALVVRSRREVLRVQRRGGGCERMGCVFPEDLADY